MNPTAIPVAILNESGIAIIVRKAGTAISKRDQSIFANEETISTPTITNAAEVTGAVTTDSNGKKNRESKNNAAVTNDANPVLAPAATPAEDSIYDVVVDVPKMEPTNDAIESANNAFPALGSLLSFIIPAWLATATNVPALSKKSTNKKVKMMANMPVV